MKAQESKVWAADVYASYNRQLEQGIDPPLLIEDLLWQTPGVDEEGKDHIYRLGEYGITTKFNPSGIQLVEVWTPINEAKP